METIKVSIIIPVYNVEKYLEECLNSVMTQTHQNLEIICIDDGSNDNSGNILDTYAQRDCRFKVLHNQNRGYGYTINTGLELATGTYIGIVESDDFIASDMYEKLLETALKTDVDFVKADYYESFSTVDSKRIGSYASLSQVEEHYDKILYHKPVKEIFAWAKYNWVGLYKKTFLDEHKIRLNQTPGAAYQDIGFWFQVFYKAKTYYLRKDAFYYYRIDNPMSSVKSKTNLFSICDEFEYIFQRLNLKECLEEEFIYLWQYFYIVDLLSICRRVQDDLRVYVAERVKEIIEEGIRTNRIDQAHFSAFWKQTCFDILVSPEQYIRNYTFQRNRKKDRLLPYKRILCYGAGQFSKRAYFILKDYDLLTRMIGFAVTEIADGPETNMGFPIYGIGEFASEQDELLVIVSTSEKKYPEMISQLQKEGYKNYITLKELM